ncbi:outer membrane beta-barrel protein [Paracoccus denitrificans]|uniref:outer membrane protein n=1 Tax=Paracoccus denitrificans TaxID=266 RepID=UPI001E631215|nr:outer membrane beta-barrel protein [Paracoccus denitrificans]UFS63946.1 outer membrane beta-barrel protein [Paracoccus denitrificans]
MCAVLVKASLTAGAVASLALGTALAANAGGYTPPVVDTDVTAPVVESAPVGDWAGAYAGLTLGYAFGGDDRVGFTEVDTGTYLGDAGKLELGGANAGLHVGYRWQRDRWVFGPELSFEAGNIKDTITFDNQLGGSTDVSSKIRNVLALRLKTGYALRPDLLLYGIAGIARADVEYKVAGTDGSGGSMSESRDFKSNGYIVGLGVERKLSDRMSVTGEYEYANFGKTTRTFEVDGGVSTQATPDYHNVKLGLNFKF